ncbi:MAG: nucleotidyl transferase AbiEii/AbiGii toxin family protein [Candidatus Omnitrophota bacterium]|nr:nucleotidyl transferase AbiEii/AbiGii toxin family protein [Candidatus Omnitrophota bacterium]
MITNQEIKNLVTEWGLRDDVIEKDYVIGWLLWGIGSDPDLSAHWAFKGGTSLKKCYIETWRFSEDLDFTILPGGPDKPETIEPIIKRILTRVHDESGIDFSSKDPVFKHADKYLYTEGRIYYRGPRNAPSAASVKLDISGSEKIARPTLLREISHPYSDTLPKPAQVRCYAFEEVFAEKLRAMGERGRPRDLYDIVLLFRLQDFQTEPQLIKNVLVSKCASKGVSVPTLESIQNAMTKGELSAEWGNMLGHQLQTLPPFEAFWNELPDIFSWLNETYKPPVLNEIPVKVEQRTVWAPPPTIWQWGVGVPLESIRFAAVNHLCVELRYRKESGEYSNPIIEPYSLRKTQDGNLIVYAVKNETGEIRAYRVDRIESIKVTTKVFKPRYRIEFSSTGGIHSSPTERKSSLGSFGSYGIIGKPHRSFGRPKTTSSFGIKYIFQCGMCMKKFTKSTNDSTLRAHKNSFGTPCSGRHGYLIGNK